MAAASKYDQYTNLYASQYATVVANTAGWSNSTITVDYTPMIGGGYDVYSATKKESALDWLDRRVSEMRVAL